MMDPNRYSMSEVVRHWAARQPGRPALRGEAETLTYGQWDAMTERVCARMRDRGVGAGDRVMYLGRNRASHPVLMAAASRARAAMVGANWRLAPRELGQLIGRPVAARGQVPEISLRLAGLLPLRQLDLSSTCEALPPSSARRAPSDANEVSTPPGLAARGRTTPVAP